MKDLPNYDKHIENAINWFWEIFPDVITAIIILIAGLWFIKFINRLTRKFFDKKDYGAACRNSSYQRPSL